MPGWIWIVLVVFMVAILVIGCAYAIMHAVAAGKVVSAMSEEVSRHMPDLDDGKRTASDEDQAPFFTQPISVTSHRYARAHAGKLIRRDRSRLRHESIWVRWARFNK